MCVFHDVRHVEFRGLTGSQRTPRVLGRHMLQLVLSSTVGFLMDFHVDSVDGKVLIR